MATSYLTPGVYVEEIDSGARPIEAVGTSTAGFVGKAPKTDAHVNEPVPITNWSQFMREYVDENKKQGTPLANAVYGFFLNGGSRCYVVNTGDDGAIAGRGRGLDVLAAIDEIAMIAAPGRTDPASYDALLTAAEGLGDRVAILDGPERTDDVEQLTRAGGIDSAASDAGESKEKKFAAAPASKKALRARDS